MSDWAARDGAAYFWKLPFITALKELAIGHRYARWYVLRKTLLQFAAVTAGLFGVSGFLFAVGVRLTLLGPWEAFTLSYGAPVIFLIISYFSNLYVFDKVFRLLLYFVFGILAVVSIVTSVELVQIASIYLGVSVLSSVPVIVTELLGTRLALITGSITVVVGSIVSLGESEIVGVTREGRVPLAFRLRIGIDRFFYGWIAFMPSLVSVILTPLTVRRFYVRVFEMYQSKEQIQDAILKSGTPLGYTIHREPELEKHIFGYFYHVSFVPPLVQIHVIGNRVVLTWLKLPLPRAWGREPKKAFKKISHVLEKWEEAHHSSRSITQVQLVSFDHGEAKFSFDIFHQTRHHARADYGHNLRMGVWSTPGKVYVKDYFYKLPWTLEGEPGNQVIAIKARRNFGEDESCTFRIKYEQTVKLQAVGDLYKVSTGFFLDGSYESTDETIQLLLPPWCEIHSTSPNPQYGSKREAMFVFQNCLPNSLTGIEALVKINENKRQ